MTNDESALLGKEELIERLTCSGENRIFIHPILSSKQIQPASVDVRLGQDFLVIKLGKITHLEPLEDSKDVAREVQKYTDRYKIIKRHERFILHPDEFVLGATLEYIRLPLNIAARLEGRSSWGRVGVTIHATAGYIDPGFSGNITFELKNVGKVPVPLYPGVRMGQLSFFRIKNEEPYRGKYQDSYGVKPSRYFDDMEYTSIRDAIKEEYSGYPFEELLEAIDRHLPIPGISNSDTIPKEMIDAFIEAYRSHNKGKTED